MTPEQVAIVNPSWQGAMPINDKEAELLPAKLFGMDGSLRPLFKDAMAEQRKALTMMLNTVVMKPDQFYRILPDVRNSAIRHATCGINDRDYDTVGRGLLWALGAAVRTRSCPAWKRHGQVLARLWLTQWTPPPGLPEPWCSWPPRTA